MHLYHEVRISWKLIPCTDCERCKIDQRHCLSVILMSFLFFAFMKNVGCLESLRKTFLYDDTLIKLKQAVKIEYN